MPEQHMEALENANVIRSGRARIKREIKAGRQVPPLLTELPRCLESMAPSELICCIPRFRRDVAESMVRDTGTFPFCKLGEMTKTQRLELAAMLRDWERCRERDRQKPSRVAA